MTELGEDICGLLDQVYSTLFTIFLRFATITLNKVTRSDEDEYKISPYVFALDN